MKCNNRKILLIIVFSWLTLQSALLFHGSFTDHKTSENCQICQFQEKSSDDFTSVTTSTTLSTDVFLELNIPVVERQVISDVIKPYYSRAPPTIHT